MTNLFKPVRLTKQYSFEALVMLGLYGGFFIFAFTAVLAHGPLKIAVAAVWVAYGVFVIDMMWRTFSQRKRFDNRMQALQQFSDTNGVNYDMVPDNTRQAIFRNIAPLHLHGVREPEFTHFIHGHDWDYAEFTYNIYWKAKNGEYRAATVYYGVISAEFPRELPNIFFDSKKARGRQFRFHFDKSQRHRLEGDFNEYFSTYFPPQYSIDGLAIITPDVMLALKAAADYDIEVIGNRVYLYGPLYQVTEQLPDMIAKLHAIQKELLDNILTYRDERLPYERGRQRVMPLGASLRRSKFWTYVSVSTIVFYIVYIVLRAWASR